MSKPTAQYAIGQKVLISSWRRGHGDDFRDGEVTKIGRKWITVKTRQWSEERFDLEGRSDQGWGHPPRLWPNREAYEADKLRRETWDKLHSFVRTHNHAPKHLSTEQIADMLATITLNTMSDDA